MSNYQDNPLKLYIQDIFRATQSPENKYLYEIFGLTFKNVKIHGVITSVYKVAGTSTNLEISDPTGTIEIYYDSSKCMNNISSDTLKDLMRHLAIVTKSGDDNAVTMSSMLDTIMKRRDEVIEEGNYVSVVGDIFLNNITDMRMISAFKCTKTSLERDVVWLEELRYIYEKFYLWKKM